MAVPWLCKIPTHSIPITLLDMGVFPRLLDHHLPPGLRDLLPDHSGQKHQFHAQDRRRTESVWPDGRVGGVQGGGWREEWLRGSGEAGAEVRVRGC